MLGRHNFTVGVKVCRIEKVAPNSMYSMYGCMVYSYAAEPLSAPRLSALGGDNLI